MAQLSSTAHLVARAAGSWTGSCWVPFGVNNTLKPLQTNLKKLINARKFTRHVLVVCFHCAAAALKQLRITPKSLDAVLAGEPVGEDQVPSIGCNIKWKPGNEPT